MDRNHLAGTEATPPTPSNAVLASIGYNFSRLLEWLLYYEALVALPAALHAHHPTNA